MSGAVDAVGATTATGGEAAKVKEQAEANGLNKDQFLQLLVAQLKNQDPMAPVGSQEFMSQMAAFSTLEQVTNLGASSERLESTMSADQSLALIGHQVTYLNEDGSSAEGKVERVSFGKEGFTLTIDGLEGIQPGLVSEVL